MMTKRQRKGSGRNRRDAARHEAAHALVAWLCGIPLKSCSIRKEVVEQDGKKLLLDGRVTESDEEHEALNTILHSGLPLSPDEKERAQRHLLYVMAGPVAEESAASTSDVESQNDRKNAMVIAFRLTGGVPARDGDRLTMTPTEEQKPEYFNLLRYAGHRAKELLTEFAGPWDGLTIRLMRDSSLSGEQVDRFLRGLIATREASDDRAAR